MTAISRLNPLRLFALFRLIEPGEKVVWSPSGTALVVTPDGIDHRLLNGAIERWRVAPVETEGKTRWQIEASVLNNKATSTDPARVLAVMPSRRAARQSLRVIQQQLNGGKRVDGTSWWFWAAVLIAAWLFFGALRSPSAAPASVVSTPSSQSAPASPASVTETLLSAPVPIAPLVPGSAEVVLPEELALFSECDPQSELD